MSCTNNTTASLNITMPSAPTTLKVQDPLDSINSHQVNFFITVQPPFWSNFPFIVNGETGIVVDLHGPETTWNSSSPTFSISGCATAAKTGQSVTDDHNATITLNAGASNCTITITDSSTSNTLTVAVHPLDTIYVEATGGTRYDATDNPTGGCDGTADVAFPGTTSNRWWPNVVYTSGDVGNYKIVDYHGRIQTLTTAGTAGSSAPSWASSGTTTDNGAVWTAGAMELTNQHCAFNDFRYAFMTGGYSNETWAMTGGGTVVVRGCAATRQQQNPSNPACRVGPDLNTGPTTDGLIYNWCAGPLNFSCSIPPPPAGSPTHHTKILGGCAFGTYTCTPYGTAAYANGFPWTSTNETQVFGGFAENAVWIMDGDYNVDVEGFDVSAHNGTCTKVGQPQYPFTCSNSSPASDYAQWGMTMTNITHDLMLQDVYFHGLTQIGLGGAYGKNITLTRVGVNFNAFSGWDMDDGHGTPDSVDSSLLQSYVTMIGNGCLEQYPITNPQFSALACWDSNDGGFGDAWSGQDSNLDTFTCDRCWIQYNTKDGTIGPHVLIHTFSRTNSFGGGNMGQQEKVNPLTGGSGPAGTVTFYNDLWVGNCNRMSQQLPGAAQNFALTTGLNGSYLGNFCRAGGDTFGFNIDNDTTFIMYNNTVVSYQPTIMDIGYQRVGSTPVSYQFTNDIFLGWNTGYSFSPFSNALPGLYASGSSSTWVPTNIIEFGIRNGDTCTGTVQCTSPLLVSQPAQTGAIPPESALDNFNFHLTGSSPAISAGTNVNCPAMDFFGNAQTATCTIGAVVIAGAPTLTTITVLPNPASVTVGSTINMQTASFCTFSDSSTIPAGSAGCIVVWTDTGAHSSIGSGTGLLNGTSVGSDTVTATLSPATPGTATVNVSASPGTIIQSVTIIGGTGTIIK